MADVSGLALVSKAKTAKACKPSLRPGLNGPLAELQIDASYIKSTTPLDGTQCFPVIASKIVLPGISRTHAHAYATATDPKQGLRQHAFLQSIGIGLDRQVPVRCDGSDGIAFACKLPCATARIMDWFHIGMRLEHLQQSLRNLQGADADANHVMRSELVKAMWLIWHGKQVDCLRRLEYLRRSTGWAGMRSPLGRLIRYLQVCSRYLVNYRQRRAQGLPISSDGIRQKAESRSPKQLLRLHRGTLGFGHSPSPMCHTGFVSGVWFGIAATFLVQPALTLTGISLWSLRLTANKNEWVNDQRHRAGRRLFA